MGWWWPVRTNLSHGNGMCRSMKKTSMAALLTSHRKQLPPEQPFHNSRWSNGELSSFHPDNRAPISHYSRSNIRRLCQTRASLSRSLRCFTRYELLSIFPKIMYERFEKRKVPRQLTALQQGCPRSRYLSHIRLWPLGTLAAADPSEDPLEGEGYFVAGKITCEQRRLELFHQLSALQFCSRATERFALAAR